MTLAPLVIPEIRGVEGKPGDIKRFCAVPGCISVAQQRHHLWPRSFLRGQPYEWVRVGDRVLQNSIGLCLRHHSAVTGEVGAGHPAHIRYNERLALLEWWEANEEDGPSWLYIGPLGGQELLPTQPQVPKRQEGLCPTCGTPSKPKRKAGPKREVKTWVVAVPDDAEQGAEVLDVYVEDLGVVMGFDYGARLMRYHVLVPALEWVTQNRAEFLDDYEAGE